MNRKKKVKYTSPLVDLEKKVKKKTKKKLDKYKNKKHCAMVF